MSQYPDDPSFTPAPAPPPQPPAHPVTPPMVLALKQTRPWVLFLSILGFVGAGLMVVVGLGVAAVMGFAGSMGRQELSGGIGAAMGVALGGLYMILGVLYLFPSLYLYRYASGIAAMLRRDPVEGMEAALRAQKSFWKFVGIAMIAVLCLYVLVILGVVLFAGLAAVRGMPSV